MDKFYEILLKIGGFAFIATIAFSWIYVAFNGRSSGPSSWGEYYDGSAR